MPKLKDKRRCSFCNKIAYRVKILFVAKNGYSYICNECVLGATKYIFHGFDLKTAQK